MATTHTHAYNEIVWNGTGHTRALALDWIKVPSGYHSLSEYNGCEESPNPDPNLCNGSSDLKNADIYHDLVRYLMAPNGPTAPPHVLRFSWLAGISSRYRIWEFEKLSSVWHQYPNAPW